MMMNTPRLSSTLPLRAAASLLTMWILPLVGQELLPNGDFELDDGGAPAFWEQRTPTDGSRILTWDQDTRRSGTRSLKIDNQRDLTSRWRTGHLGDLCLKPETTCTISGWIRTASIVGTAHFRLYCLGAQGNILSQPSSATVTGTEDWQCVELRHRIPPKAAYIMVYAEVRGTGSAWFDDLDLHGTTTKPTPTKQRAFNYSADVFDLIRGFRLTSRLGKRVTELPQETADGQAQVVFWGDTARYDVTITYVDENDGVSHLDLVVNGKTAGGFDFDRNPKGSQRESVLERHIIRGVDMQTRSRIVIQGRAGDGERCRVHAITFQLADRFQGDLLPVDTLKLPPNLFVFENPAERKRLHGLLGRRGMPARAKKHAERERELGRLKTPEDWRARQHGIRARLKELFGEYGPKCPLNSKITGRIEHPAYTIEKLVFESQPSYYCTANVYLPKGRKGRRPAAIFTIGHAGDGKAYHLYHECCLGLVLKGYVVLALDPTGQGERSEYIEPETRKDRVPRCVSQHHYLGRPSWLVGRCLAGYRTWDCIRAVDYLITRTEVDPARLAAVGNSGGGQMALLITAVDERIAVCAAAHPGGSQENTYLKGQSLIDRDVLSLIPPRPCVFIVGEKSGEAPGHKRKLDDMLRFYRGLAVEEERGAFSLVDGIHDMKKPKREAAYAWLNRWLGQENETDEEPALSPESVEALHCTASGSVLVSLGGETGQTLNAKLADRLRPTRPMPTDRRALAKQLLELKQRIQSRIGLRIPADRPPPKATTIGECQAQGYTAKKLLIQTEPDIGLPALLLQPTSARDDLPVVLHVSQQGKPTLPEADDLALQLARQGVTVFSLDARGAGETDPRQGQDLKPLTHYDPLQWRVDSTAIALAYAETTTLALRALDTIRAIDYLRSLDAFKSRPVVLVGEELGGLWAMMATAFDPRPAGVVCVRTLPSYKLIVGSQYYEVRDYFWTAGALQDFDICDLPALIAPRSVALLEPMDAMRRPIEPDRCALWFAWARQVYALSDATLPGLQIQAHATGPANQDEANVREILAFLANVHTK